MNKVHYLTSTNPQDATVRCESPRAQYATYDLTHVTCEMCKPPRCTCAPGTMCAACRQEPGARVPRPRQMISEKVLLSRVMKLAKEHGWLAYHTHNSRHSVSGFPDLVLAKAGRPVIMAELKSLTGKLRAPQEEWLAMLHSTMPAPLVCIWRPNDWDAIVQILTG